MTAFCKAGRLSRQQRVIFALCDQGGKGRARPVFIFAPNAAPVERFGCRWGVGTGRAWVRREGAWGRASAEKGRQASAEQDRYRQAEALAAKKSPPTSEGVKVKAPGVYGV